MTMNSVKSVSASTAPAPATVSTPAYFVSKTTESMKPASYDCRKDSLETQVFDLWSAGESRFRIECGPTTFGIEISEEKRDTGKREVIACITDLTAGITRTSRGRATCAVQYQSIGWYVDLANIDQVRELLQDSNNPGNLKTVIRHLIKGDITDKSIGDAYSRRAFNNTRYKVLSARRRNDRDAIRSI